MSNSMIAIGGKPMYPAESTGTGRVAGRGSDVATELVEVRAVVISQVERPGLAAVADDHRRPVQPADDDGDVSAGGRAVEDAVATQHIRYVMHDHPVVVHRARVAGFPGFAIHHVLGVEDVRQAV